MFFDDTEADLHALYDDDFPNYEDRIEMLGDEYPKTKEDIITNIRTHISTCKWRTKFANSENDVKNIEEIAEQLKCFLDKVKQLKLFERPLPDAWVYSIDYSYSSFEIKIAHPSEINVTPKDDYEGEEEDIDDVSLFRLYSCIFDASYTIFTYMTPTLNVEEYAKKYSMEEGTVRQWIRRGKIRNARKTEMGWLIPALTPPVPDRGYKAATYTWTDLDELPDEYEFFRKYCHLYLCQDLKDSKLFNAKFSNLEPDGYYHGGIKEETISLSAKEREKLELFLIKCPKIKFSESIF